jgi:protein phosphatase
MSHELHWNSASRSDVGRVRLINEDACLELPEQRVWAVADGMGGHAAGDVASRMVVEALQQLVPSDRLSNRIADARERLQSVNSRLREEALLRHVGTIGSTVALLLACDRLCALLWAGDSRIYLYRDGCLKQLTRDHSHVEALRSQGYLSDEEAARHPSHHLITRAVGADDRLELDEDIVEAGDHDVFLLCSDGVSNELDNDDIAGVLATGDCRQAAHMLVDMALQRGGRDNISAIVIRADDTGVTDKTLLNPAL